MPQKTSTKKQMQVLIGLLAVFAIMLAYTFRNSFSIPTAADNRRYATQIHDRIAELKKATDEANEYQQTILERQNDCEKLRYTPNLEREAQAKIDRILDDANVTRTKNTVSTVQNRNKTNILQVTVTMEFEDITMRKLCDLFETFAIRTQNSAPPMQWTKLTINSRSVGRRGPTVRRPGQPPQPGRPGQPGQPGADQQNDENKRQLNVTATVTAYCLDKSASDLLFAAPKEHIDLPDAAGKTPNAKNPAAKGTTKVNGSAKGTKK